MEQTVAVLRTACGVANWTRPPPTRPPAVTAQHEVSDAGWDAEGDQLSPTMEGRDVCSGFSLDPPAVQTASVPRSAQSTRTCDAKATSSVEYRVTLQNMFCVLYDHATGDPVLC